VTYCYSNKSNKENRDSSSTWRSTSLPWKHAPRLQHKRNEFLHKTDILELTNQTWLYFSKQPAPRLDIWVVRVSEQFYEFSIIASFLLAYFPKVNLWDLHPVCVPVYPPPPNQLLNAWTNLYETFYVYHGNLVHLDGVLHKSLPSVCVSVCATLLSLQSNGSVKYIPHLGSRQRIGKQVPKAMNTRINRIAGRVIFYAVRVLSKESLWVCLRIPLMLLGNNSVTTFPRQRRIGGIVFYAVRVVSKDRGLLLPRTYCFFFVEGRVVSLKCIHPISYWEANSRSASHDIHHLPWNPHSLHWSDLRLVRPASGPYAGPDESSPSYSRPV
jgi:hypothetical protein